MKSMKPKHLLALCTSTLAALAVAAVVRPVFLRAADPKPDAESAATAEQPIRALLVCGGCCHDYAHQKDILTKGISARANVEWTIAYDKDSSTQHLNPVYANPDWSKGFDVIVHDECSADVKDPATIEKILAPHQKGLPAVNLHCAMHCYRADPFPKTTAWMEFTGMNTNHHGAQLPIDITFTDNQSPITKGMANWTTIKEELYHEESLAATAHPLASGAQGKEKNVVVWTNDYHGARVFSTTLGHNNETVADARYLDLITRGLLWSVNKLDEQHLKPAKKVMMDGAESNAGTTASPSSLFKPDAKGMVPEDLAHGKKATASTTQGGNEPQNAVDGDDTTRWCASDASMPQWLQVDLGTPQDLVGCRITWEKTEGYKYKVEGSADAKAWTTLADNTGPDAYKDIEQVREHKFEACCGQPPINASAVRYVRVNVLGTERGAWASLFEFEVFGKRMVKPAAGSASASGHKKATTKGPKAPDGFDVTMFAAPPDVAYPTCVAAAPAGEVFVGIDEDGSLGKAPNRGRVVRCIDTTGSGKADKFNVFATMDHPRGLVWDDGKLYVLHPPFLTVYYDDNHTGTANRSEDLITGISTEKSVAARGADHTTNGIRLGIDGWIYIATGDFGALNAVGKDGTRLSFHGGGVLRVRTDGSGLEVYSWGHRNIYDVAIDPLMNIFTRDNTNDGDLWNDRLAYEVPTGYYGYPSRFLHFPGEFIDCLNDYGGGSPCGSIFIDEPSLPKGWNHDLLTVEWGNSAVYRHPLVAEGADYKRPTPQEKLMDLPRGTDIDVDGQGHVYETSWANGGFDYSGPHVGYVLQLTPKDAKPTPFPDMRKASDEQLLAHLASPSGVRRLAAQREILRRGERPAVAPGLERLAASNQPLSARVAAIYTMKLLLGDKANATLESLTKNNDLRPHALRAMADRKNDVAVSAQPYVAALSDPDPRTRLVASWCLGRLGKADAAKELLPLLADPDFLVRHVTTNSLVTLHATDLCLKAIDPSNPKLAAGALQVLQQIHEVPVVTGLTDKLSHVQDATLRGQVLAALCRLNYREADWDGSWWGTRPDTRGPYFKNAEWDGTPKVREVLQNALAHEKGEVQRDLIVNLQKHQIDLPGLAEIVAKAAASDPAAANQFLDTFGRRRDLTAAQIATVKPLAESDKQPAAVRAKALRILANNPAGQGAATDVLASVVKAEKDGKADPALSAVLEEYVRENGHAKELTYFSKLSQSDDPAKRELADSVLVSLAGSRLIKFEAREAAAKAVEKVWDKPASAASLLRAIGRTKAQGYAQKVEALSHDPNAEVASAATYASDRLGLKHGGTSGAPSAGETIEALGYDRTVSMVLKDKGDALLGKDLFTRQGCVACHTTSPSEPPKGPMLAGIAARNTRADLCESIMKPSAKVAQGFETQYFKTADGDVLEGFVVREGGDEVELRNVAGVNTVIKKSDIKERGKRDKSVMPEGLVAKVTPHDLASLIAYLESLNGK